MAFAAIDEELSAMDDELRNVLETLDGLTELDETLEGLLELKLELLELDRTDELDERIIGALERELELKLELEEEELTQLAANASLRTIVEVVAAVFPSCTVSFMV